MPRAALRVSHKNIVLNDKSIKMEERLGAAILLLLERIHNTYGYATEVQDSIYLADILAHLKSTYPEDPRIGLVYAAASGNPLSGMRPDGGFIYVRDKSDTKRCILVTEAKRQGVNKDRIARGLKRQAKGNAIERLRKNMQGVDALFAGERITPFVCFGEGDDFESGSTILDRVSTMNGFFPLNTVYVDKIYLTAPEIEVFAPASLFFREDPWTAEEMLGVIWQVCLKSIPYYEKRYGPLKKGSTQVTTLPSTE